MKLGQAPAYKILMLHMVPCFHRDRFTPANIGGKIENGEENDIVISQMTTHDATRTKALLR